jgi:hypothetical protein
LEIKGIEAVKETKELAEASATDGEGSHGIDNSRLMVTYKYSTCPDKFQGIRK